MDRTYRKAVIIALVVMLTLPAAVVGYNRWGDIVGFAHGKHLPDFQRYSSVDERKRAFIDYLFPLVEKANQELRADQRRLFRLYQIYAAGYRLTPADKAWLVALAGDYNVSGFTVVEECSKSKLPLDAWFDLFTRVDTVPVSLALAQAANESAWGTSRFAREGYNLFGEWCFAEGCGIKPRERVPGLTHEVKSFDTVYASVQSYVHNLNTRNSYQQFRDLRSDMRRRGVMLTGETLANGLVRYSERGAGYIEIIRSVIQKNGLQRYDSTQSVREHITRDLSS